ncbi:hypothetical protein [Sphingomonas immobilis]|uniref:Uncharacterized protein n=1 Tax=Sphingomonas immobilis TaxID=3063997 RepID=A0ABT8ZYS6_9SPHN|nr:hypothetical protein [Sphingomonas sp. CA1-15]MDO7842726.1 hypothetical protein [Sphingomonas sp. CA1-15]
MWSDIRDVYRAAGAFALACPLLFLIPPLCEMLQHVVEYRIGMYDSLAAFKAVANDNSRMGFGILKVVATLLPGYWFTRFMGNGHDVRAAHDFRAFGWWGLVMLVSLLLTATGLFLGDILAPLHLGKQAATFVGAGYNIATAVLGIYLTAWGVAWALGNRAIGPRGSIRIMAGSFWRTIGYVIAGALPLMIVHYALGYGALGRPPALLWPMLTLDALVVGLLALTLAGASFVAARHAAAKKQVSLA